MIKTKDQFKELINEINENSISLMSFKNTDNDVLSMYIERRKDRHNFCKNYSWAIPDSFAISTICSFVKEDQVLQIGAGLGLWAKLLELKGISVIPTDDYSWDKDDHYTNRQFLNIIDINHLNALKKYKTNCLFLCWPPYNSNLSYESLVNFEGNKVVYIGEGMNGVTGTEDFHNLLNDKFNLVCDDRLNNWSLIYDRLYMYERK